MTEPRQAELSAATSAVPCPTCGYDLRGQDESRCPECGQQFSSITAMLNAPGAAVVARVDRWLIRLGLLFVTGLLMLWLNAFFRLGQYRAISICTGIALSGVAIGGALLLLIAISYWRRQQPLNHEQQSHLDQIAQQLVTFFLLISTIIVMVLVSILAWVSLVSGRDLPG